jgi:3-phenylpropionate/trans-cinnamate dioxygenase ferredoxin subunit
MRVLEKTHPAEYKYFPVLPVNELPTGERLFLELEHEPIVVINLGGRLHAFGDICSHDHGPLGDGEVNADTITCPRHGARFDLHTGKALSLPATEAIPVFPIRVVAGMIEIGILQAE